MELCENRERENSLAIHGIHSLSNRAASPGQSQSVTHTHTYDWPCVCVCVTLRLNQIKDLPNHKSHKHFRFNMLTETGQTNYVRTVSRKCWRLVRRGRWMAWAWPMPNSFKIKLIIHKLCKQHAHRERERDRMKHKHVYLHSNRNYPALLVSNFKKHTMPSTCFHFHFQIHFSFRAISS